MINNQEGSNQKYPDKDREHNNEINKITEVVDIDEFRDLENKKTKILTSCRFSISIFYLLYIIQFLFLISFFFLVLFGWCSLETAFLAHFSRSYLTDN